MGKKTVQFALSKVVMSQGAGVGGRGRGGREKKKEEGGKKG